MNRTIDSGVRYALMTCALSALASPAVFAQSALSGNAQNQNTATTQLKSVEVTGTRIKRSNVETAQPITVITAKQIRETGVSTVAEVLQNITQAGSSLTREAEIQGKNSATNIDLRYFGASRVLVLVNGRRWTPDLGGTVDLSSIPASMIDHIEILQDGASAIYGSDAITGVVNIITVKNFNGAEAHAYMGMYDNDYGGVTGWDGKKQLYSFTVGSSGTRAGIVVNAQYEENEPVWSKNRAQSREPIWTQGVHSANATRIGAFEVISPQLANQTLGSVSCTPKGACTFGIGGTPSNAPTFGSFNTSNKVLYNTVRQIAGFTETNSIYAHLHYNIANNLTFTSTLAYNRQTGRLTLNPTPGSYGAGGRYKMDGIGVGIGVDNPYNPFGVDLVGNAGQYCPDGKTLGGKPVASCTPNYLLNFVDRILWEQGYRYNDNHVGTETARMGLNGFFDAIGNEWDWDLGYSYGTVYSSQNSLNVNSAARVATALNSPGVAPCNGPAQAAPGATGTWQQINGAYYQILQPGCVPLNLFGGYNLATKSGSITPAMYNYIEVHDLVTNSITMRDYTGDVTGNLIQLPAGPLAVAIGGEYLEEDGFAHPDNVAIQHVVTSSGGANETGRTWTQAEYVEFNIPLLSDVPLAKSLNIDLANRWSQFSWMGGEPGTFGAGIKNHTHATTGRAQMRWQPSDSLLLRASWSQGFRAPSLDELYSGASQGFIVLQDPCAPDNQNGGWNPSTPLPSGCNGIVHQQPDNEIRVGTGGNPELRPETAITRSFGFVYSPSWLPGFNLSADYYDIDVGNEIGSVSGNYILDQCYVANVSQYCGRITTSGNIVSNINTVNGNIGEIYSHGIDVAATYAFPATPIGDFSASTNWTFVRSFVSVRPDSSNPTGFSSAEQAGFGRRRNAIPKARGQLSINWNLGNWSAVWNVQYIGHLFEACSGETKELSECSDPDAVDENTGTMGKNHLGTTIYNDAAVTYHVGSIDTDFTLGIRNLLNKQFPAALTAANNSMFPSAGYRIPGRFFYARIGVKF